MKIFLKNSVCRIHYYNELMIVVLEDSRQVIVKDLYVQNILKKNCEQGFFDTEDLLERSNDIAVSKMQLEEVLKNKIESGSSKEFLSLNNYNKKVPLTGEKGKQIPLKLQIEVTRKCNLNCSHCYKMANLDYDSLTCEQIECILKEVGIDLFEIGITGGEPLVHSEFNEITKLIEKHASVLSLNTNGVFLSKVPVEILQKYKYISISLYGTSNEEYQNVSNDKRAFEALQKGTKILSNNNIKFNISVLLNSGNTQRIEEYVKTAIDFGAASIQFGTIDNIGRAKMQSESESLSSAQLRKIYREMRRLKEVYHDEINIIEWTREWISIKNKKIFQGTCFKCQAGSVQWVMTEKGRFKPCVVLPEEEELEFTQKEFFDSLSGRVPIDWENYYDKLKCYCHNQGQLIEDFCDRIKNPGEKYEKTN